MKKETIERIRKFTEDRDWDQFHDPSNLAKFVIEWGCDVRTCGNIDKYGTPPIGNTAVGKRSKYTHKKDDSYILKDAQSS